MRYLLLPLALVALFACNEKPTVQSITPAASAEEQARAKASNELLPDFAATGIDHKLLIDTWLRIKVRNATDDTQLSSDELGDNYTVQFNSDRTYRNYDGQVLVNGKWKWNGSDIVLDEGKQTITIVSVGQGFMTWKFNKGGKTFMYTFKSSRQP